MFRIDSSTGLLVLDKRLDYDRKQVSQLSSYGSFKIPACYTLTINPPILSGTRDRGGGEGRRGGPAGDERLHHRPTDGRRGRGGQRVPHDQKSPDSALGRAAAEDGLLLEEELRPGGSTGGTALRQARPHRRRHRRRERGRLQARAAGQEGLQALQERDGRLPNGREGAGLREGTQI